jgi:O-antigen ligase
MLAAPFLAGAVIVLFLRSPQLPFLAVLVFASTFADAYALPKSGPLYPAEAMVFLGLAALPFFRSTALGGVLGALVAVFLGAVVLGIIVASGHGVRTHEALLEARTPVLYASFWLALAAARADRRRFMTLVGAAAAAVAVLTIAQFLVPGHAIFRTGQLPVITSDNGFLRVRPPGLLLAYFGAIFGLAYLIWGARRRRLPVVALVALFAATILISLNRNMIVGIAVGLIAAFVVVRGRAKASVRIVAVAAAAAAIVGVAAGGTVVQRILSLGNVGYLQQTTLADRAYEDAFARATIARHPISGIGWGVSYGAQARDTSGLIQPRSFVHNQYYELWLKTGILGLASYVGMLLATGLAGIRLARRELPEARWAGAAVVACVVGFAASSIVGIYVLDAGSTPVVVALLALAVSWEAGSGATRRSGPNMSELAAHRASRQPEV